MSITVWIFVIIGLGYPIAKIMVQGSNDRSDARLRQMGFRVSQPRRHVNQYVPRIKQPPRGFGLRGPVEGRFWGSFR